MDTYSYQKTNRYFAQVADDIKEIAEEELLALGATDTKLCFRGIHFSANPEALYSANLHSSLINRILAPLISFTCHSDRYLYKRAMELGWEDFLDPSRTFAVFAAVSHSSIRHSKFAALRLKDAIVDRFRNSTGERPSIDTIDPDVWINLHVENNEATISLDTSGGSLHRRGYRRKSIRAPMIETLAAAIIRYSEWDGSRPLYDPFCGSGTLLCEGYLRASRTPPAILREKFGFESLPDFDASLWGRIKKDGQEGIKPLSRDLVAGSDISPESVEASTLNCASVDTSHVIDVKVRDVFEIDNLRKKTIVCNPPYGIRMGRNEDLSGFYRRLGDFLKRRCEGSTAYIYFGNRKYIKNLGLKPSWKRLLYNGGLDGRLVKYELY